MRWIPLAIIVAVYGALIVSDSIWPMAGSQEAIALQHPDNRALMVYFSGSPRTGGDQLRGYILFPDTFRTGEGFVVSRVNGRLSTRSTKRIVWMPVIILGLVVAGAMIKRRASSPPQ